MELAWVNPILFPKEIDRSAKIFDLCLTGFKPARLTCAGAVIARVKDQNRKALLHQPCGVLNW
jgi:hypothetical protein